MLPGKFFIRNWRNTLTDKYYDYLSEYPYGISRDEKHEKLNIILKELTLHHIDSCPEYARIINAFDVNTCTINDYEEIPFLPVRIFKEFELMSCKRSEVVKTMTSSGTTGQQVSKIYLDKETSVNQQKILTRIVSDFLGKSRLPMIILDTSAVVKDRNMFSARGAGILGFSMFGRDKIYALDDDMELNIEGLRDFLDKHRNENIFLFGFTFMIWQHFYSKLKEKGEKLDLSNGIMIHGGGWKKLEDEAVSPDEFKNRLQDICGITKVYNYYGMVEQTGSIYMECEYGHLHASIFSDVIIRNPIDWSECGTKERGLIEAVSVLPLSYPGHLLLTEDEGCIEGEDDCPCGRKGKYFKIFGRVKNAEIRGCSDTYADKFGRN